jgi:hypothetical protein
MVRVVAYAVVGGILGAVPGFIAKETFLHPIWDEGWKYLGNGLGALAIGSAGGATGAVIGVLLARRQLRQDGEQPEFPSVLSLPALGLVGAFLGSIIAAGVWGAVVVGVLLLGIAVLAAQ